MPERYTRKSFLHHARQRRIILGKGLKVVYCHYCLPSIDLSGIKIHPSLKKAATSNNTFAPRALKRERTLKTDDQFFLNNFMSTMRNTEGSQKQHFAIPDIESWYRPKGGLLAYVTTHV